MPQKRRDRHGALPALTPSPRALSRRQLLKALAASSGALGAASLLPGNWVKPVVEVGCLPAFAQTSPQIARRLYWAQGSDIYRATLEGTDIEMLISGIPSVQTIRLDTVHGKIYWGDVGKLRRANLDGSGAEDFADTVYSNTAPAGIAFDPGNNRIFWTEPLFSQPQPGKLRRASLDGSGVTELVSGDYFFQINGLALDVTGGKIYWSQISDNKIQRSDLDGSNIEDIITGLSSPQGIVLDLTHGKIYWVDQAAPIKRADLDGSNIETLVTTGLVNPFDIALDIPNGHMYWVDMGGTAIKRANLDGSGVEAVVTSVTCAISLALDLT